MIRNILAVVAGNLAWSALWLGSNALLKSAGQLPSDPAARIESASTLSFLLVNSVVFSIIAGLLAATISTGQSYWPVVVLCGVQLAMGIFFQLQSWKLMPVWYHLSFLFLLVPTTLFGAWLRLK